MPSEPTSDEDQRLADEVGADDRADGRQAALLGDRAELGLGARRDRAELALGRELGVADRRPTGDGDGRRTRRAGRADGAGDATATGSATGARRRLALPGCGCAEAPRASARAAGRLARRRPAAPAAPALAAGLGDGRRRRGREADRLLGLDLDEACDRS